MHELIGVYAWMWLMLLVVLVFMLTRMAQIVWRFFRVRQRIAKRLEDIGGDHQNYG